MFVAMKNLRELPPNHNRTLYICRKGFPALNCLMFAGYDHFIYDCVPNAPGSFHDSTVYNLSSTKPYLESRVPRVQVLGRYLLLFYICSFFKNYLKDKAVEIKVSKLILTPNGLMIFFILGDSAYALNDTIITPYSSNVAAGMVTKALFNVRYAY